VKTPANPWIRIMSQRKSINKGKKDEPVIEVVTTTEPEFVEGRGTFVFSDNSKYEGDYQLNVTDGIKKRHGTGSITWNHGPTENYTGQWFEDRMNGPGVYLFASGARYQGNMKDNVFDGEGMYVFADGAKYSGQWQQNKMHGAGEYVDPSGVAWKGRFFNGLYDSGETHISLRPTEGI
jgi:hypothetical protein